MPDRDYAREFRQMRRRSLLKAASSLLLAFLLLFAWTGLYAQFSTHYGYVYLIGWFVILGGWYFGYAIRIDKSVVCPACQQSLTDIDGWNLFIKACPHCGVSFRPSHRPASAAQPGAGTKHE